MSIKGPIRWLPGGLGTASPNQATRRCSMAPQKGTEPTRWTSTTDAIGATGTGRCDADPQIGVVERRPWRRRRFGALAARFIIEVASRAHRLVSYPSGQRQPARATPSIRPDGNGTETLIAIDPRVLEFEWERRRRPSVSACGGRKHR